MLKFQVCCMRKSKILLMILHECLEKFSNDKSAFSRVATTCDKCDGFLCISDGICGSVNWKTGFLMKQQYYDIVYAISHVFLITGNETDLSKAFLPTIRTVDKWGQCLDRREVSTSKISYQRNLMLGNTFIFRTRHCTNWSQNQQVYDFRD